MRIHNRPFTAFALSQLVLSLLLLASVRAQSTAKLYDEPFRPQFHFTPEQNWMNDPNGLVYYQGEYHLFYQYNPFGNSWGHMSWGHAVSNDLVHWRHLPVALAEENGVMIFSGSVVVDWRNTSGLCRNPDPKDKSCLVAIYTGHIEGVSQTQHIAVSNDRGRTWTKYARNPVIDIGNKDFRDPKVIWHDATKRWVMVVSLSKEQKVRFYGSRDLKVWELLSEFGPAGVRHNEMLWECPDLFELPLENQRGKKRWVLIVNISPGGATGGSGGQYFIGSFDGRTFTNDNPNDTALFVDYGKDFYAGVTFSDVPPRDGRRLLIGWMSNWQYAQKEPTQPWRTAQSIPRALSLRQTAVGVRLVQRPVVELQKLRGPETRWLHRKNIAAKTVKLPAGDALEIIGEFAVTQKSGALLRLRSGADHETVIGCDAARGTLWIDRTRSGDVSFDANFAGRHEAPLPVTGNKIRLHIFADRSSVEVFANDGAVALTERIFPPTTQQRLELANDAHCLSLRVWPLRSIWQQ